VFKNLEERFTCEFEQFLGIQGVRRKSLQETQADLQRMDHATGAKTALIYVAFKKKNTIWEFLNPEDACQADSPSQKEKPAANDEDTLSLLLVTANQTIFVPFVDQKTGLPLPLLRLPLCIGEAVNRREINGQQGNDKLPGKARELYIAASGGTDTVKNYAQTLYKWLLKPIEQELKQQGIQHLSFILDRGLRTFPIAALHDGKSFIIERYGVSQMPSFSLINPTYRDLAGEKMLAMGASKFPNPDIHGNLPAASEITILRDQLWRFPDRPNPNGIFKINQQEFTPIALQSSVRQGIPIVHLVTHANFDGEEPDASYLYFGNIPGKSDPKMTWKEFGNLKLGSPPPLIELMVLSACKTAFGNEQAELGFAGAAARAEVKSVIASLWQIEYSETFVLMMQFYRELSRGKLTKQEALRRAQQAMLKGEVRIESNTLILSDGFRIHLDPSVVDPSGRTTYFDYPRAWSGITLIGSPW
jgi:CHAT domain-containing protein